jgi:hypothetical protein
VAILHQYAQVWRVIWTDGRPVPKVVDGRVVVDNQVREPRYYGYSVGRWVDDNTLLVDTVGTMGDDRAGMDSVRASGQQSTTRNEESHRVDHDCLELTVTIDDPNMYTKRWIAMNRFPMTLVEAY